MMLIGIRVRVGRKSNRASLTKWKSVKSKIWFKTDDFPLTNGQIVVCRKTNKKYQIVKPDIKSRKSKYKFEGRNGYN